MSTYYESSPSVSATSFTNAQLELFNVPKTRHTDGDTSRDASLAVSHEASRQETRILERFAMFGPMTDQDLVDRSPQWHDATIKSARSRLSKRGYLVPDGKRTNRRGRDMTIWKLAP